MSSWRRAGKTNQKMHHERHQPEHRQHLGLLQKKKDYKTRAQDVQHKREALLKLKKKALNRNPDQFVFHMVNSRVIDGKHHELEKEDEHSEAQIRLMETQDFQYIANKRNIENRKIMRFQSHLHLLDEANHTENKHLFFVDTKEEVKNFDVAKKLRTHEMLLNNKVNRLTLDQLKNCNLNPTNKLNLITKEKEKAYSQLAKRISREKELNIVQRKLELKRHLNNKHENKPVVVKKASKDSAAILKWNYERKK